MRPPSPGGPSVGLYLHHVGSGHRHRGATLAVEMVARGIRVTGLGSGGPPPTWPGAWVELARDDQPTPALEVDTSARGRLHWVPLGHPGLLARQAAVSAWLRDERPDVVVVDVSQEVALLARLHGVAVVSVVLPGRRGDAAHRLGLGVSEAVVGFWPPQAHGMVEGLDDDVVERLVAVGGSSRFAPDTGSLGPTGPDRDGEARRVLVLAGRGGGADRLLEAGAIVARAVPSAVVDVVGPDRWVADPWPLLRAADVVVCQAGQNSVAEVAAARRPAVVVPAERPHDEQQVTAAVLHAGPWPAVTAGAGMPVDWAALVRTAAGLDGRGWAGWVDGGAAARLVDVVTAVAERGRTSSVVAAP